MKKFDIKEPDKKILNALISKIDNLTKPKGSLGRLEDLAIQIGLIQQTLSPKLTNPHNILFAADHGIISEGVSVSPKEVTYQQLLHFSRGGAGINFLCNQHDFKLVLVDSGVDADILSDKIINRKIRKSTNNFLYGPAMSVAEFEKCIDEGAKIVHDVFKKGCNVISFGEMGSGNTSAASLWMHILTDLELDICVGAGAGLNSQGISHKLSVLQRSLANYAGGESIVEKLAWFGGFEMAMALGGMLAAAELKMIILVDGFIMSACILAASYFYPDILHYAIFSHVGDESGHKHLLEKMNVSPILNLGLRLGEGTGAVCAYPIVESGVRMINEMDSFKATDVTKYFD